MLSKPTKCFLGTVIELISKEIVEKENLSLSERNTS